MKKSIFTMVLSLFLIFFTLEANAQQNIIIVLKMPPPGTLNVSDFWNITVTNNSGSEQSGYLVGTAKEDKDGMIAKGTTVPILFKKGINNIKIKDLPKTPDVEYTASDPRYKESLIRQGKFPSGKYEICVKLISVLINEELGSDCINQEVLETGLLTLINPADGEDIDSKVPITFTWSSGGKVPEGGYTLKIVEVMKNQTPEIAMQGNKAWFVQKGIKSTTFAYPNSAKGFEEGKSYAWGVSIKGVLSAIWLFRPRPIKPGFDQKFSCESFKMSIIKNDTCKTCNDSCCYSISIINNYSGPRLNAPESFRIISNNANIISSAGVPSGWNQTPDVLTQNTKDVVWNKMKGSLPTGITNMGTICFGNVTKDPFYLLYELMNSKKKVVCKDSVKVNSCSDSSCQNNLIRNGEFDQGNQAGQMPSPGSVQNWDRGYGYPKVDNNPIENSFDPGYLKLSGNLLNGQSVMQAFDPTNKIVSGRYYKLSLAFKFKSAENSLDYTKIRAIAFNGNIYSPSGIHPQPSTDVAIIGRSGKIHDCGDWSIIEFSVWKANKDFLNIAINAFTNDNQDASILIDDVTLCETTQEECVEVQLDDSGNPIMPNGYAGIPPGFTCQPEAEEDEYYNGSLQDLYPGYDGTTDLYSQNTNPCFSIGGTLPPEVLNYNCDDSLKAAGIKMTCDELQSLLNEDHKPVPIKTPYLPPISGFNTDVCDSPNVGRFNNMAFHGRDIIYVHGLMLRHLCDRANNVYGSTVDWPDGLPTSTSPYYNGYYKNIAENNWKDHIDKLLRGKGNLNRYLIVSYNCSQSAEVAINSILTQIQAAMNFGEGVECDASDPRKKNCFGRDFVLVSHSTGAIIADVSISIANMTKTNSSLKSQYGDIGLISDRCKGRMSINGAFSGSNLATIMCYAQADPILSATVSNALTSFGQGCPQNLTDGVNQPMVLNSILVDLVPPITRARWGFYIDNISVPVFDISGGHPTAIIHALKYVVLPGFDDGVVSMDCASGRNNNLSPTPSSFSGPPHKVFDMGIPFLRACDYFLDQKVGAGITGVFASASSPYLAPNGMVEPISSLNLPLITHFNNHFPFIQSSSEHWLAATQYGPGHNNHCDYEKTFIEGSVNNEEELVVNTSNVYAPGLVDPSIISQMGETIKKKSIWIPWPKMKKWHGIWIPWYYMKEIIIWKRTYHKLHDNCTASFSNPSMPVYAADYGYKYLFKQ